MAALFRVTVQVLDALLPSVEGAQATRCKLRGSRGGERESLGNTVKGGRKQGGLVGGHRGDGGSERRTAESGADTDTG